MIRRSILALAAFIVVVLVAVVIAGAAIVRRPFPQTDGEIPIAGLSGEAKVLRDAQGVPQIYAETPADLFRAQGFVQAQDRFFEMDYRRHVTSGRLSELVGENADAIAADRVIRTFGWRHVAEQEWELISSETRNYLTAYADGVNEYLAGRSKNAIAMEYTVLGAMVTVEDPAPWDPIDSLAWLKAMAWDLRGNYDEELERALAYGTLQDVGLVNELFPVYDADLNAPILGGAEWKQQRADAAERAEQEEDLKQQAEIDAEADAESEADAEADVEVTSAAFLSDHDVDELPAADLSHDDVQVAIQAVSTALDAVPHTVAQGEGTGSNSWAISGEHTESGKPLLANDPHLGLAVPSIWAQVGLHCVQVGQSCPFDVSGFSFAGFPGVVIGHNQQLSWGLTNLGADVTDFYIEALRDDDYRYDGEWKPLQKRTEKILVNGADPITIDVFSTEHGPIVSSELGETVAALRTPLEGTPGGGRFGISLAWTALTPGRTADAVFKFNLAKDATDIAEAAAEFDVPSQNVVFATADGHIGYQAPGKIPIRVKIPGEVPSDGSWPRAGWDPRFDWQGFVAAEDMPAVLDPEEGFIVAANQAVLPDGDGPFLTNDWDYGYRSQRIRSLIEGQIDSGTPVTVESMSALQNDDWSPFAALLVPILLEQDLDDSFARDGQALLRDWDHTAGVNSAAAAYFAAVWANILEETFWDDLPQPMWPTGGSRWLAVVEELLKDPTSVWWDNRTTVNVVETRDEILSNALANARLELTTSLGKNADEWKWGRVHLLELEHPVLGGDAVPAIVRNFVNPDPVQMAGGSSIVNATAWDASKWDPESRSRSFGVTAGPSMRMVVDMDDLDASRWVVVSGVSGHPGHPHYADQLGAWAVGGTYAWPSTVPAVNRAAVDTLTLVPAN